MVSGIVYGMVGGLVCGTVYEAQALTKLAVCSAAVTVPSEYCCVERIYLFS